MQRKQKLLDESLNQSRRTLVKLPVSGNMYKKYGTTCSCNLTYSKKGETSLGTYPNVSR